MGTHKHKIQNALTLCLKHRAVAYPNSGVLPQNVRESTEHDLEIILKATLTWRSTPHQWVRHIRPKVSHIRWKTQKKYAISSIAERTHTHTHTHTHTQHTTHNT